MRDEIKANLFHENTWIRLIQKTVLIDQPVDQFLSMGAEGAQRDWPTALTGARAT